MAASAPVRQLLNTKPFQLLEGDLIARLEERSELVRYELGARVLSPEQSPPGLLVVLQGDVRLMARLNSNRVITMERRGPGQLLDVFLCCVANLVSLYKFRARGVY